MKKNNNTWLRIAIGAVIVLGAWLLLVDYIDALMMK